eukprot:7632917-Pyramimonas_sp.AAC.1
MHVQVTKPFEASKSLTGAPRPNAPQNREHARQFFLRGPGPFFKNPILDAIRDELHRIFDLQLTVAGVAGQELWIQDILRHVAKLRVLGHPRRDARVSRGLPNSERQERRCVVQRLAKIRDNPARASLRAEVENVL